MGRLRIVVVVVAMTMLVGAGAASAAKVRNGDFETGDYSRWKTKAGSTAEWRIYTNATRDVPGPAPQLRGGFAGITLPKTLGSYSPFISMSDPGHNILYRTIEVPDNAKRLSLKAYWHNAAAAWVFDGDFKSMAFGNQFFSIDLLKKRADPETTRRADVLANLFAPDASDPPPNTRPRRGTIGSTTPYVSGWSRYSARLGPHRGRKVVLRLAETDTLSYNYVGIDNVKIATRR